MVVEDVKVTSDILWKGAIFFSLIDVFLIFILIKFVRAEDLRKIKWRLIIYMAIFFCLLFGSIVSIIFWDSVYIYVFPAWIRWIIPPAYGLLFSLIGLFCWWLAFKLPSNPVMNFCILGGFWGLFTHILAIHRGILEKPPMLQGASPIAALTLATFEFIFYWSICLGFTCLFVTLRSKLFRGSTHKSDSKTINKP
jgi:hypothetical protein